jgi:MFS family permease
MQPIFYGWWIVSASFLLSFYVSGVVFSGFTAFFGPIREEMGWSSTQISLAISLRGLEMGIFAPVVGYLADRFGVRRLILIGVITMGFGLYLLSQVQTIPMFYASILFIAFGAGGCAAVVITTAVANWFQKRVGIALGIVGSGVGLGGLMIPLIVRFIDLYSWRSTIFFLGWGMWILGIPLALIMRNRPEQYGQTPDGVPPTYPAPSNAIRESVKDVSLGKALKNRSFLYLNIAEIMRSMAVGSVSVHVMPYLESIGLPRPMAGVVAAGVPLFTIIGRFAFGWIGDVYEKRIALGWSFGLVSLGMLTFGTMKGGWLVFPFLLLYSSGLGGGMTLRAAILREYFGRDSFGKMIGIVMGAGSIGGIIGPTLAGAIFDILGDYRLIWFFYALVTGLSMVLVLKMESRKPADLG